MPHGTPDWNVTAGAATTHQLTDLGELAVRLGSINQFDRRGDVIFMEDFESGTLVKWAEGLAGGSASFQLSTERARSGCYSARLKASAGAGSYSRMTHYNPYPVLSAFGLEASISREVVLGSIRLELILLDGEHIYTFGFRWSFEDNEVSYTDDEGEPVVVGNVPLSTEETLFHTFKLVGDIKTGKYVRALINNREFDLAGILAHPDESEIAPAIFSQISVYGGEDIESLIWVDDVILTQNEHE